MGLIELPCQYGGGTFWVNVSRIVSIGKYCGDNETQIDLAGYDRPVIVNEPVATVLARLRSVGVKTDDTLPVYIRIADGTPHGGAKELIEGRVYADYDANGNLLGVEVVG